MDDATIVIPSLCHCALPAPPSASPAVANGMPLSTHPEAARLVVAVAKATSTIPLNDGIVILVSGPLKICYWSALAQHTQSGYGVWWDGRIVLLAAREEAWLYHPGEEWEAALSQVAAAGGNNASMY